MAHKRICLLAMGFNILAMIAAGCAAGRLGEGAYATPAGGSAREAVRAVPPEHQGVIGVWEGQSRANCSIETNTFHRCNAQQNITLTLIEGTSGMTGFYRCAYGNLNCFDMNETGNIVDASLRGTRLTARVAMPDGTSCLYSGIIAGSDVSGGYLCYGGAALLESGTWRAKRSY